MTSFPRLEHLAERVVAGEAVFFIGAGFSRDIEHNTTERLIFRLLARFEAIASYLEEAPLQLTKKARQQKQGAEAIRAHARKLRTNLRKTFGLEEIERLSSHTHAWKLSGEYYNINDWMTTAFKDLLGWLSLLKGGQKICQNIHDRELELYRLLAPFAVSKIDPGPLPKRLRLPRYLRLGRPARGKALFLDTMGFDDQDVMAGKPLEDDQAEVAGSYGDRLWQRHHVLAWLAREGLSATLLTTNYDLLVEGAYRMAGFAPRVGLEPWDRLPATTYQRLALIARPSEFFSKGAPERKALVVKLHGCANRYRERKQAGKHPWQSYLPSMVFTYREIQNWREDSWSRDLLTTLLRTRTLVFCGYSGMDPVLHDTFRTVYEEMSRQRRLAAAGEPPNETDLERAPAFFLGISGRTEFHGQEILRAASRAVGVEDPPLHAHPNYLQFRPEPDGFPRLDDLMLWLFHRVFRRRQQKMLRSDLRRVAAALLGHSCAETEVQQIEREFAGLCAAERSLAQNWTGDPEERRQLNRVTAWTADFHAALLREFALAETVQRDPIRGLDLRQLRRWPWYFPALDRPEWAAWAVVVELAIRRLVAAWQGRSEPCHDSTWVRPARWQHPVVVFSKNKQQPTPVCLSIQAASFTRVGRRGAPAGEYRRSLIWNLGTATIPWPRVSMSIGPGEPPAPSAAEIWQWASGSEPPDPSLYVGMGR